MKARSQYPEASSLPRDLGVLVDGQQLSPSAHVAALCRSGYYQLRQFRPICPIAHNGSYQNTIVSCHLDYCNSLLYSLPDNLTKKLQSDHNAAARLITGTRRCEHISPVLRELHWLPVRQRVKVACLAYQSLSGQAPQYLATDIQLISDSGRRHLCSSSDRRCVVPRTQNTFGDRSFCVAGPRVWNRLPKKQLRRFVTSCSITVSYTHLTLPTIYSV